eukprot:gene11291-15866_t
MQCPPMRRVVDKLNDNKNPNIKRPPRPRRARAWRQLRRALSRKARNKLIHALNGNGVPGWKRAAQGGKGWHAGGKGGGGKGHAADKPLTHADLNAAIAQALKAAGPPKAPQHTMPIDSTNPKVAITRDERGQELRQDPSFASLCPPLMLAREDFLRNHGATKGKKLWNEAGKKLAVRAKALARGETPEQMMAKTAPAPSAGGSGGAPAGIVPKKERTERQRVAILLKEAKRSGLAEDIAHFERRLQALDAAEAERPANKLKKVTDELNEVGNMIERLAELGVDTTALETRQDTLKAEKNALDGGDVDEGDTAMSDDLEPKIVQAREALEFLEARNLPTAEVQQQLEALTAKQREREARLTAK